MFNPVCPINPNMSATPSVFAAQETNQFAQLALTALTLASVASTLVFSGRAVKAACPRRAERQAVPMIQDQVQAEVAVAVTVLPQASAKVEEVAAVTAPAPAKMKAPRMALGSKHRRR